MLRFILAATFFAAAMFTISFATAEDKKPDEKKEENKGEVLKTIIDVKADFDKEKKTLTVTAIGQVPTGGWKDAKLIRRTTKDAPKDGIYEYDLTAVRPTGFVTQVISKVKAEDKWENPPADLKGIKVYGSGEAKTVKVEK